MAPLKSSVEAGPLPLADRCVFNLWLAVDIADIIPPLPLLIQLLGVEYERIMEIHLYAQDVLGNTVQL